MNYFFGIVFVAALLLGGPLRSQDNAIDLRGVGLIIEGPTGGCTGTLVKPDLVLTAAHCVLGRKTGGDYIEPERYRFFPSTVSGVPGRSFPGASIAVHPVYLLLPQGSNKRLRRDIALIRLVEPVPAELATPLPVSAPDLFPTRGFLLSYRGQEGGPLRQRSCPVISEENQFLVLGCKVVGGESGSPVLVKSDDGMRVYAVVSSRFRIKQQPVALAAIAGYGFEGMLQAMLNGQGR